MFYKLQLSQKRHMNEDSVGSSTLVKTCAPGCFVTWHFFESNKRKFLSRFRWEVSFSEGKRKKQNVLLRKNILKTFEG